VSNVKKYCLDTSGLSNPLAMMPEDLYSTLWSQIEILITSGIFAVTTEIYEELKYLSGSVGECIKRNSKNMVLEVGDTDWDWKLYLNQVERLRTTHESVISEYNNNRSATVGFNDVSIVALAKSLNLPVISMEAKSFQPSATKIKIPKLCKIEDVEHLDFNEFLRKEGIKV
jgi:heme/copper-type cytochrome/quinol oxidase subunit 2